MPARPIKPCSKAGCAKLVRDGGAYCEQHRKDRQTQYEQQRGSSRARGYDSRWEKARLVYLQQYPLCVRCQSDGHVVAANVVDHIEPHKGDMQKFWNVNNWQSLCKRCHDSKTAKEDGRWR